MGQLDVVVAPTKDVISLAGNPVQIRSLFLGGVPRGAAVVLVPSGELDGEAAETMNLLAEHGYESVACDADGLSAASVEGLVAELLRQLAGRDWRPEQVGILGFGHGATAILSVVSAAKMGAAVAAYPVDLPEDLEGPDAAGCRSETPLLVLWPGSFGVGRAQVLRLSLDAASPVSTEVVSYEGVRPGYVFGAVSGAEFAASYESWQRIIEFLDANVVPKPTPLAVAWATRNPRPDSVVLRA